MSTLALRAWDRMTRFHPKALLLLAGGSSFWVASYRDRDDIHQWNRDWMDAPKHGLVALSLFCPNGRTLGFQAPPGQDLSGRAFQIQDRALIVNSGAHQLQAQIIGLLTGTNGECKLYAWEPPFEVRSRKREAEPANDGTGGVIYRDRVVVDRHPGRSVEGPDGTGLDDNFYAMQFHGVALQGLSQAVLGVAAD